MPHDVTLVYLYDGSFDGLLTCLFEGYARHQHPDAVAEEDSLQVTFGQEVTRIDTDDAKARRVERGIVKKMGDSALEKLWITYLSTHPDKATAIYRYVQRGLDIGRRILDDLAHPDVLALDKIYGPVGREAHLLKEFLRFSLMEGGVFYAKISPEHNIIPLLMPHFVDRYCVQPFLIHDNVHGTVGVYDLRSWHLVESADLTLPDEDDDELGYKRMWKHFYDTIAVRERYNPKCRMGHMPKKYWKNMNEHTFIETPKTKAQDARRAARAGMARSDGAENPAPSAENSVPAAAQRALRP